MYHNDRCTVGIGHLLSGEPRKESKIDDLLLVKMQATEGARAHPEGRGEAPRSRTTADSGRFPRKSGITA
jgi:hypothetical protein